MAEKQASGLQLGVMGLVGAGVVAAGLYFAGVFDRQLEQIAAVPAVEAQVVSEPAATSADTSAQSTPQVASNDTAAPEAPRVAEPATPVETAEAPVEEAEPAPQAPVIDEVRVEPDGLAIIAGRAQPSSTVAIFLDGIENTTAPVEASGTFAAITLLPPSDEVRVLTLVQRVGTAEVASVDEVILAPVRAATPAPEVPVASAEKVETSETAAVEETPVEETPLKEASVEEIIAAEAPLASAPVTDDVAAVSEALDAPEAEPAEVLSDVAPDVSSAVAAIGTVAPIAGGVPETINTDDRPRLSANAALETSDTGTELALADPGISLSPAPQDRPAPAEPGTPGLPGGQVAVGNADAEATGALPKADDAAPGGVTDQAPARIAILRSTEDGVEVLSQPQVQDNVSIDTISYSDLGQVELAGRAQQESRSVRVYLDNRPIATLDVDPDGRWRGGLPDVDTGVYRLRVDEISDEGRVLSRIETPFKREDPEVLEEARNDPTKAKSITVQTGNTLWAIARERYGEPLLYVQIFEANKDAIRDPDLIFPGQVFDLPDE